MYLRFVVRECRPACLMIVARDTRDVTDFHAPSDSSVHLLITKRSPFTVP